MNRCEFSQQAAQDLDDIYEYLAQFSLASAARVVQAIEQTCRNLARFPGIGTARDDLQPGLRSFPSGRYVIVYRPLTDGVRIVRIVHGARDLPSLFGP